MPGLLQGPQGAEVAGVGTGGEEELKEVRGPAGPAEVQLLL